jgi:biofilm PGA synthesis lipoprotein PgaB
VGRAERAENTPELPFPKSFLEQADYKLPSSKVYYRGRAVVLTYHHISKNPFSSITIKPERFEADLNMLKSGNFNVISLRDLTSAMEGKAKLPPNAVVITFDDGLESFYEYAFPLLKKYNMPAASFIITARTENWVPSDAELHALGRRQIREMYSSGLIDIQSHSHNSHSYVKINSKGQDGGKLAFRIYDSKSRKLEAPEAYDERADKDLDRSAEIIRQYTDNRPYALCFPFGHYTLHLVDLGKNSGYSCFVTTESGYNKENSGSKLIKRIRSGDSSLNSSKLKTSIINCGRGGNPTEE